MSCGSKSSWRQRASRSSQPWAELATRAIASILPRRFHERFDAPPYAFTARGVDRIVQVAESFQPSRLTTKAGASSMRPERNTSDPDDGDATTPRRREGGLSMLRWRTAL